MCKKLWHPGLYAILVTCLITGIRDGFDKLPLAVTVAAITTGLLLLLAGVLAYIVVFFIEWFRHGIRFALKESNPVAYVKLLFGKVEDICE